MTFAAMKKLREHGLSIDNILNTEEDVLANLIHPVGFWKVCCHLLIATMQVKHNSIHFCSLEESFIYKAHGCDLERQIQRRHSQNRGRVV